MACPLRRRALVLTMVAMAHTAMASADTPKSVKERCIEANAHAQSLRRGGDFTGAREQLKTCIDARCPRIVRDDCTSRLDELERTQSTIVLEAKNPDGADLSAVDVSVDGRPWTTKLDGTALPVDPGEHTFTFEVAGQPPAKLQLVVREGEKGRHVAVVIGTPKPPPAARAPAGPAAAPPPPEPSPFIGRPLGVVAGGVGLAAIAAASVFGLLTKAAVDHQNQECPSTARCNSQAAAVNDHNQAVQDGLISDVGFIAGGVLLASGVALFFLSSPRAPHSTEPTSGFSVLPSAGPSGGGIALRGAF